MDTRRVILIVLLSLATLIGSACPGGSGGNNQSNKPRSIGPWLYCTAEEAEWFTVEIDGDIYEYNASLENELDIDIREYISRPGTYDLSVTPVNRYGRGKEIFFMIDLTRSKSGLYWQMVPIDQIAQEDPEYLKSFSSDLELTTGK